MNDQKMENFYNSSRAAEMAKAYSLQDFSKLALPSEPIETLLSTTSDAMSKAENEFALLKKAPMPLRTKIKRNCFKLEVALQRLLLKTLLIISPDETYRDNAETISGRDLGAKIYTRLLCCIDRLESLVK